MGATQSYPPMRICMAVMRDIGNLLGILIKIKLGLIDIGTIFVIRYSEYDYTDCTCPVGPLHLHCREPRRFRSQIQSCVYENWAHPWLHY